MVRIVRGIECLAVRGCHDTLELGQSGLCDGVTLSSFHLAILEWWRCPIRHLPSGTAWAASSQSWRELATIGAVLYPGSNLRLRVGESNPAMIASRSSSSSIPSSSGRGLNCAGMEAHKRAVDSGYAKWHPESILSGSDDEFLEPGREFFPVIHVRRIGLDAVNCEQRPC